LTPQLQHLAKKGLPRKPEKLILKNNASMRRVQKINRKTGYL
jgi:hypothetical protein